MPHLSPMFWPPAILAFYLLLMIVMSSMWWHTTPKFPYMTTISPASHSRTWNWN